MEEIELQDKALEVLISWKKELEEDKNYFIHEIEMFEDGLGKVKNDLDRLNAILVVKSEIPIEKKADFNKKINKAAEIRRACSYFINDFSMQDIEKKLSESENPKIRSINKTYIAEQLYLLAKQDLLEILPKGKKGSTPKVYKDNKKSSV